MADDPLVPPAELPLHGAWRDELARLHATPPRHYHTLKHVEAVARNVRAEAERTPWNHPAEVFAAALFHDAVYVAGRRDNEERSAELAVETLPRWTDADLDLERVAELIRLTAQHSQLSPKDVDNDAARFLDCDMAILAAPEEVYDAYAAGVAAEYSFVDPDAYTAGRAHFLREVLSNERIFLSDSFHQRCDGQARRNLQRELSHLEETS